MSRIETLKALQDGMITVEEAQALLGGGGGSLTVKRARDKVTGSLKGTVSVYGLGRFPVSLYANQWERLAEFMPQVIAAVQSDPTLPRK